MKFWKFSKQIQQHKFFINSKTAFFIFRSFQSHQQLEAKFCLNYQPELRAPQIPTRARNTTNQRLSRQNSTKTFHPIFIPQKLILSQTQNPEILYVCFHKIFRGLGFGVWGLGFGVWGYFIRDDWRASITGCADTIEYPPHNVRG